MSKHTPEPLKVRTFQDTYPEVQTEDGKVVCSDVDTNANAYRIVQCWNAHDDLLAALEEIAKVIESRWEGEDAAQIEAQRIARKAIAKARGETGSNTNLDSANSAV